MEGTKCHQPGCSIHDFLPFLCPKCEHYYCLDHRSRFNHTCQVGAELNEQPIHHDADNGNSNTVKTMFQSITDRFKSTGTAQIQPTREHLHRIHSTAKDIAAEEEGHRHLKQRLDHLDHVHNSTSNDQTKKISNQTKHMLIKSRAKGGENVPVEDRFYLTVFPHSVPLDPRGHPQPALPNSSTNTAKHFYFPRYLTLGEVLVQLKQKVDDQVRLPVVSSGHAVRARDQYGLVIQTRDTLDWKLWNFEKKIEDLFTNFEEIFLHYESLGEIVAIRSAFQRKTHHDGHGHGKASAVEPTASTAPVAETASNANLTDPTKASVYAKGEKVWYYKTIPNEEEVRSRHSEINFDVAMKCRIPLVQVTVLSVHFDDFPNIYYTISMSNPTSFLNIHNKEEDEGMLKFFSEKQTDAKRLLKSVSAPAASPAKPQPSASHHTLPNPRERIEQLLATYRDSRQFGATITINIAYKNQNLPPIDVGSMVKVGQLKELVSLILGTAVKDTKLIYKGTQLKFDAMTLVECKIVTNAKIMVLAVTAAPSAAGSTGIFNV